MIGQKRELLRDGWDNAVWIEREKKKAVGYKMYCNVFWFLIMLLLLK